MTELSLPEASHTAMREHAEREYPNECCGFLIGSVDPLTQHRTVHRTLAALNRAGSDRGKRFAIVPQDLADLEEALEPEGLTVLGFYHSHPDHPAVPSGFDTEHAWPWYSYVIVRVNSGRAGDLGCFELDAERREFRSVRTVASDSIPRPPAASHAPSASEYTGRS